LTTRLPLLCCWTGAAMQTADVSNSASAPMLEAYDVAESARTSSVRERISSLR
jgi:hypothetical protein